MYEARGNEVWINAVGEPPELFLTVHITEPVRSYIISTAEQAEKLAEILNQTDTVR